jgi:hypothetical protein
MEEITSYTRHIIDVITYKCDGCNKAKMIYDNNIPIKFNPILYSHRCPVCGMIKLLDKVYPYTRTEAANEQNRKCA